MFTWLNSISSKKHYEEESKDKHYDDYEKRKKQVYETERDRLVLFM